MAIRARNQALIFQCKILMLGSNTEVSAKETDHGFNDCLMHVPQQNIGPWLDWKSELGPFLMHKAQVYIRY